MFIFVDSSVENYLWDHCDGTRREFLREILYKNIAIIAI